MGSRGWAGSWMSRPSPVLVSLEGFVGGVGEEVGAGDVAWELGNIVQVEGAVWARSKISM